jgi:hypothetical protein
VVLKGLMGMDEITKRFEIIRLAIQLDGDYDTILIQCRELQRLTKNKDAHLNEIISLLKSKNYRQALYEMKYYAQNLERSFLDIAKEPQISPPPPQTPREETPKVIGLDEIMELADDTKEKVKEYQATPEFPAEEILEQFKRELEKAREKRITSESKKVEEGVIQDSLEEMNLKDDELSLLDTKVAIKEDTKETKKDKESFNEEITSLEDEKIVIDEEDSKKPKDNLTKDDSIYSPISYIDQKFNNMIYQYPPIKDEGEIPDVVKEMRDRLSIREYSEEDIEEFLDYYFDYKEQGKIEEAAKVLLLGASTESKFAKFLLARELFKGEVLKKNETESFNLINSLADQNYPEAICDLGQFYEHGVAIVKDKQMAMLLYEEAAELGVERAKKHYERLKNSSKGVMGILNKINIAKKLIKKDDK